MAHREAPTDEGPMLVFAREVGGARFIVHAIKEAQTSRSSRRVIFAGYGPAVEALACGGAPVRRIEESGSFGGMCRRARSLMEKLAPSVVWLSATPGFNLEKALMRESRLRSIRTVSFVDHYWNLWQRFCHPRTRQHWAFVPDEIRVVSDLIRTRLVELGCPAPIRVTPPKSLGSQGHVPVLQRAKLLREIGLGPGERYVVFVSEPVFRPGDGRWEWDQAANRDYVAAVKMVLDALGKVPCADVRTVIKMHPAESRDWPRIIGSSRARRAIVLKGADNASLVHHAEIVLGFNSMMLLEAAATGARVAVFDHPSFSPKARLLHDLFPAALPLVDARKLARRLMPGGVAQKL